MSHGTLYTRLQLVQCTLVSENACMYTPQGVSVFFKPLPSPPCPLLLQFPAPFPFLLTSFVSAHARDVMSTPTGIVRLLSRVHLYSCFPFPPLYLALVLWTTSLGREIHALSPSVHPLSFHFCALTNSNERHHMVLKRACLFMLLNIMFSKCIHLPTSDSILSFFTAE